MTLATFGERLVNHLGRYLRIEIEGFVMRIIALVVYSLFSLSVSYTAFASDVQFFKGIQGKWSGPGEIVAGKYKGTKYICTFDGTNPEKGEGMVIDGSCRVGVFSQKMTAHITKKGSSYKGAFLDGAKGDGMDVTGGRYTRNRIIVDIVRKNLKGTMVVNLEDRNQLKATISVRHNKQLIPVIGMNLKRIDTGTVTSSIK